MNRAEDADARFVVCIDNSEYPVSLELHKIYRVLADEDAARDGDLRVVDESGEDYLYPGEYFLPIRLPTETEWLYAAVGPENRTYPWGEWEPGRCNSKGAEADDSFPYTAPVGSFAEGESWCRALNLAGNVSEWCADGKLLGGVAVDVHIAADPVAGLAAHKVVDRHVEAFALDVPEGDVYGG